jgi:hypothetical protein
MNTGVRQLFFVIAVAGWVTGLSVHILAVCGIDVGGPVWGLHVGAIAVFIPFVIVLKAENPNQHEFRSSPKEFYRKIFKYAPNWMRILAVAGFIYAFFNFFYFFLNHDGDISLEAGKYVVKKHGRFLRYATEEEYIASKPLMLRGFSGHWIAFYGIAAAGLFKRKTD